MKPFKFLDGKPTARELATWDFYDNYDDLGAYHTEVVWCDDFISFLSRFDADSTVLVKVIKFQLDNDRWIGLNARNFCDYIDEFTSYEGMVRVAWLNFD